MNYSTKTNKIPTKICSSCGIRKPLSEFVTESLGHIKQYGSVCKSCRSKDTSQTGEREEDSRKQSGDNLDTNTRLFMKKEEEEENERFELEKEEHREKIDHKKRKEEALHEQLEEESSRITEHLQKQIDPKKRHDPKEWSTDTTQDKKEPSSYDQQKRDTQARQKNVCQSEQTTSSATNSSWIKKQATLLQKENMKKSALYNTFIQSDQIRQKNHTEQRSKSHLPYDGIFNWHNTNPGAQIATETTNTRGRVISRGAALWKEIEARTSKQPVETKQEEQPMEQKNSLTNTQQKKSRFIALWVSLEMRFFISR